MPRTKAIPIILIDSREQTPYSFSEFGIATERATLHAGDYSIAIRKGDILTKYDHMIAIERKTLDNWIGDITGDENRTRLEASILRGTQLLTYYAVIIEGSELEILGHRYTGKIEPKSVLNTKIGWSLKYRVPIELAGNQFSAEYQVYTLLTMFLEYEKKKNRKQKDASIVQKSSPAPAFFTPIAPATSASPAPASEVSTPATPATPAFPVPAVAVMTDKPRIKSKYNIMSV